MLFFLEGARYAAKAKSGQLGTLLFKDTKQSKAKKFSYKQKAQTFPIRKVQPAQEVEAVNRPTVQRRPAPTRNAGGTAEAKPGTNRTTGSAKAPKEGGKDFVRKNAQKVSGKKKAGAKDVNTIALTQDQLNAILKTIGQAKGSENVASVEIADDGGVKVVEKESQSPREKGGNDNRETPATDNRKGEQAGKSGKPSPDDDDGGGNGGGGGSENILALLAKVTAGKSPSPVPSTKPPTPSKSPPVARRSAPPRSPAAVATAAAAAAKQSGRATAEPKQAAAAEEEVEEKAGRPATSRKEDQGQMGFATLSLAERKRLKWKQELNEQESLRKQQTSQDRHVQVVLTSRIGGKASERPPQERAHTGAATSPRAGQQVEDGRVSKDFSPDISPRAVAPSSLGSIATQRVIPAAMRSSFFIGGQGSAGSRLNDHNTQLKKQQQQEWLEELERQRVEAQERKARDKKRQQDYEVGLTQQWAEPQDPPRTRPPTGRQPQPEPRPQMQTQDDTAVARQRERDGDRQEAEQPRSAPSQGAEVGGGNRSHIRPNNLLVDPVELERREAQRQKHLEHMLAIKAQVEEKQRLKREAEERRRLDEAEEEQRLSEQRLNLQRQFDTDKDKQRRKEEEEAKRHRTLVESMQTAHQQAQQEKHLKRLDKLSKMGHDTSNLRRSWDNQPDFSPRPKPLPDPPAGHKNSPRGGQSTMPQPVQHSPELPAPSRVTGQVASQVTGQVTGQVAGQGPVMVDAFTSPVYDQAVQTDFHFTPHEAVSLQGGQLQREPSAGIEFRADTGAPAVEERGVGQQQQQQGKEPAGSRAPAKKPKEKKRATRGGGGAGGAVGKGREGKRTASPRPGEQREDQARQRSAGKTERPVWGAGPKTKSLQRNSDKDLTVSRRRREERRRQRAAELLAEQERNAPTRLTKAKRARSPAGDAREAVGAAAAAAAAIAANATAPAPASHPPNRPRAESERRSPARDDQRPGWRGERSRERAASQPGSRPGDGDLGLPDTPPVKDGDFVPFLRTSDPLMSGESVPVTPESRQRQRHRKTIQTIVADDGAERAAMEEGLKLPVNAERDPLLNPDRLRDTEQRQTRILQQLSHLRQGLMMKQREMELGLGSPASLL